MEQTTWRLFVARVKNARRLRHTYCQRQLSSGTTKDTYIQVVKRKTKSLRIAKYFYCVTLHRQTVPNTVDNRYIHSYQSTTDETKMKCHPSLSRESPTNEEECILQDRFHSNKTVRMVAGRKWNGSNRANLDGKVLPRTNNDNNKCITQRLSQSPFAFAKCECIRRVDWFTVFSWGKYHNSSSGGQDNMMTHSRRLTYDTPFSFALFLSLSCSESLAFCGIFNRVIWIVIRTLVPRAGPTILSMDDTTAQQRTAGSLSYLYYVVVDCYPTTFTACLGNGTANVSRIATATEKTK